MIINEACANKTNSSPLYSSPEKQGVSTSKFRKVAFATDALASRKSPANTANCHITQVLATLPLLKGFFVRKIKIHLYKKRTSLLHLPTLHKRRGHWFMCKPFTKFEVLHCKLLWTQECWVLLFYAWFDKYLVAHYKIKGTDSTARVWMVYYVIMQQCCHLQLIEGSQNYLQHPTLWNRVSLDIFKMKPNLKWHDKFNWSQIKNVGFTLHSLEKYFDPK